MLPYRDINPTRRFPLITTLFIVINALIFVYMLQLSMRELQQFYVSYSVIPAFASRFPFAPQNMVRVLSSMFLHAGFAHLAGNMLYL